MERAVAYPPVRVDGCIRHHGKMLPHPRERGGRFVLWERVACTRVHRQYEHGVPGEEKRVLLQKGQTWEASIPTGNGRNRSSAVLNCGEPGLEDFAMGRTGEGAGAAGLKRCVGLEISGAELVLE